MNHTTQRCRSLSALSRSSSTPSVQINTKLPCPEDLDLDQPPRPNYSSDDIVRVQRILLHFVPAELADAIIDLAEYWPYVGTSRNDYCTAYSALDAPDSNAQWGYLVSPKVPSVERNGSRVPTTVKMVKFSVKTYESSWGKVIGAQQAKVPNNGSKTWFEASVLKNDWTAGKRSFQDDVRPNDWFAQLAEHPKYLSEFRDAEFAGARVENPFDSKKRWHVTNNPESAGDHKWHEVVWKHDDQKKPVIDPETGIGSGFGFLDSLSVDDRIILMARALSPGMINTVFNVNIEIYYALSSSYL